MGSTTVEDAVIWAARIQDDPSLAQRIADMWPGETINLEVDGVRGVWRKAERPPEGGTGAALEPVGSARTVWRYLMTRRHGQSVSVRLAEPRPGVSEDEAAFATSASPQPKRGRASVTR
jgi:hypothetical protein